ncbi:MAG: hypothetical protein ACXWT1_06280 [Methylobacter sp.]
MDINKKNRSDLKSYFVKNSIPTQSNFEALIDGMLNQKDDGIVKSPDALCIEATGDLAGLQRVINFYAKFQDDNPAWSLQLNPRTDANVPATAKLGFCVVDGAGWARLFIDQKTGNVGIGTTAPIAKLDIHQSALARVDTHPTAIKGLYITGDFGEDKDGIEFRHRNGSQGIGFGYNTIYAAGSNLNQDLQLKPKGTGVMRVLGVACISNGKDYAAITKYMSSGSLTIGGTDVSFGGSTTGWNANTAGLLLETSANTEIAVHHSGSRLASLMYYDGSKKSISIGRDMGSGWGLTPVTIAGDAALNGCLRINKDIKFKIGDGPNGGIFFSPETDTSDNPLAWLKFYDMSPGQINRSFSRYMLEISSARLAILSTELQIKGDLTINGRIISESWIDAKLENNWVRFSDEYNPPQYFKDNAGIVWLRGLVKDGSSTIFTLPEGYRPANRQLHVVFIHPGAVGRVDVTKDGKVEPVVGHSGWTSLDGISFRAAPKSND